MTITQGAVKQHVDDPALFVTHGNGSAQSLILLHDQPGHPHWHVAELGLALGGGVVMISVVLTVLTLVST